MPLYRDRIRTAINVLGDSYGAGIVAHLSRAELAADEHNKSEDLPDLNMELNIIEDGEKCAKNNDGKGNDDDDDDPKDPGNGGETIYPSIS